jgi:magnesium chelatase family protein
MTSATAWSVALFGVDGSPVTINADITTVATESTADVPGTQINREMLDRARAAIRNSRLAWPNDKVTVTASGQLPDNSPMLDLAVACAVLAADGQLPPNEIARTVFVGELGLDGSVRAVRGALSAVLAARRTNIERAIVPMSNLSEAALVAGMRVLGVEQLADVVTKLRAAPGLLASPGSVLAGSADLSGVGPRPPSGIGTDPELSPPPDLPGEAVSPETVRAVEVAAAGGHHLLLVSPSGSGRALPARLLHRLRPSLTNDEALEVTAIHSIAGLLEPGAPLVTTAPLITPHCSTSLSALLGGGPGLAKPGAISLAHHGILVLDDVGDFSPDRLDAVRAAVVEGEIRLARRDGVARYPAQFQMVLTSTPCPCGGAEHECTCSPQSRRRFLARISGPLLDRVDLRLRLSAPDGSTPSNPAADAVAILQRRVRVARSRAAQRWAAHGGSTNATVPARTFTIAEFRLPKKALAPLDRALDIGALTARGGVRTLRVAWTLADLAGLARPGLEEITEALAFRDRRNV